MAAFKCPCPGCRQPLQVQKELPARLKCPRCATRFTVGKDGSTSLTPVKAGADTQTLTAPRTATLTAARPLAAPPAAATPPASAGPRAASPVALWSVVGGGALLLLLG